MNTIMMFERIVSVNFEKTFGFSKYCAIPKEFSQTPSVNPDDRILPGVSWPYVFCLSLHTASVLAAKVQHMKAGTNCSSFGR